MESLKKRWNIQSNFQLVIIFIVFAITGSTSVYITTPLFNYLGIAIDAFHPVIYYILKIILIFPVYLVLLISFGTIAGQFRFFWNFEKKMLKSMGLGFLVK
jgi:manganese efflux pump family protein